jgi:hypothetical protein
MPRCPNCNYSLVLLEHRQKYKCPKCSKLFSQKQIETLEFQKFNKFERQKDKERILSKPQPKQKQLSLSRFTKKDSSIAYQRKFRKEHREEYNTKKREYWASNREHLLEKRKENYILNKDRISSKSREWNLKNPSTIRLKLLRQAQKRLALQIIENRQYSTCEPQIRVTLPTLSLSYLLYRDYNS